MNTCTYRDSIIKVCYEYRNYSNIMNIKIVHNEIAMNIEIAISLLSIIVI